MLWPSRICRPMAGNQGIGWYSRWLERFSNISPCPTYNPNILVTFRCTCNVFLAILDRLPAGHSCSEVVRPISITSVMYIDHTSMHTGRASVGFCLMSEQIHVSVDYRPVSMLGTPVNPRTSDDT